jgi:DNA-directed RNA polymerase alpha subunit/DNA-directed RNA polymerase subunit L
MENPFSELNATSPFEVSFKANDVDLSIVNSLRRVILSEVENVGFFFDPTDFSDDKDIMILENDSPLHNEFLQHRIALIPINVNTKELENWDKDKYKFVLKKENKSGTLLNVYSSDFEVVDTKTNTVHADLSKRWFPADPISKQHIIITKLQPKPKSKLHIEAYASMGTPIKSASFGMVSNISIEFAVDDKVAQKELVKFLENNKEKSSVESLTHQFNSIERERHYKRNKYREPNVFNIRMTSECTIPCKYIFQKAINILQQKVINFQNSSYEIVNHNMLFSIIITDENHTLGNLYQSLVFNHYIRENTDNTFGINYIGYNVPHPLENILLIKIKGDKLLILDDVRTFINQSCDYIYNMLNDIDNQWNTLSNK